MKALLIVDMENCFRPGEVLPVADCDRIVRPLNTIRGHFVRKGWRRLYSRCWHPRRTTHFKERGGPWEPHGIRGTYGAKFHPGLDIMLVGHGPESDIIISKAMGADEDGYSPICPNAYADPECLTDALGPDDDAGPVIAQLQTAVEYLEEHEITELVVGGVATDYCVLGGVMDALVLPFIRKVYLLMDAIGAVNVKPGDGARALRKMEDAGAILTSTEAFMADAA